jgi:hypothetical protein
LEKMKDEWASEGCEGGECVGQTCHYSRVIARGLVGA